MKNVIVPIKIIKFRTMRFVSIRPLHESFSLALLCVALDLELQHIHHAFALLNISY